MLVQGMVQQGLSEADARKRFYICDKDGLLGRSRGAAAFAQLDPLAWAFARQDEGLPSSSGNCKRLRICSVRIPVYKSIDPFHVFVMG